MTPSSGFTGSFGDAFDEEIEDGFRGALGLGAGDAPAWKMAVDIHPGEAIDQSAAGDLVTLALLPGATATPPPGVPARRVPDELSWEGLLEEIFEADQVIAW